ncbi:protein eva-1 homolog C isoform X2 [Hyla sarda]|uniref:protein eva-1 homolog C isoform X2 n=1 Tax=Hyla sarda TaxID=327740 RepID=UPI0024C33074|nr:protein eva-1 homolog C isoform X2 [Hyla sarda]
MIRRDGYEGRQVEPLICTSIALCIFLLWTTEVSALADFSGYLTKLLQNHTVFACDGEHLTLQCPRHSTVSIQSAFYGHSSQSPPMCASSLENMPSLHHPCLAQTALQKVLDECQNLRSCQLPVNSRVFGIDPCPGITKYLVVSYKCKPTEYKSTSVCENHELKLHCKEPKLLNIYSAVYGSLTNEKNPCANELDRGTPYDCVSYSALNMLAQRCYGKQRCRMVVHDKHFGSPCLPGVVKYLTVNYTCVPKIILKEVDPKVSYIMPPTKLNDDIKPDLSESRLPSKDGLFFSDLLAAYSYVRDHPERAALFFVCSLCIGLFITLFALVIHISWRKDCHKFQKVNGQIVQRVNCEETDGGSTEDEEGEDEASTKSHFSHEFRELCKSSRPVHCTEDAADLAERIERREQIIHEIWLNSGLDIPPSQFTIPFF